MTLNSQGKKLKDSYFLETDYSEVTLSMTKVMILKSKCNSSK